MLHTSFLNLLYDYDNMIKLYYLVAFSFKVSHKSHGKIIKAAQCSCGLQRLQAQKDRVSFRINKVYFIVFLT